MKRTAEEAAQTRRELLDAALRVFSRQGYQASRLVDIAEEADVTRGAIYHHFGNKAGLFRQLIESAGATGDEIVAEAIEAGGPFLDILNRILVTTFERIESDRRLREIMTLYLFQLDVSGELADVREKIREDSITAVGTIADQMQQGITSGELRPTIPAVAYARSFIGFQNGVIDLWLGNPEAFSLAEEGPALADAFLNGFAAQP